MSRGIPYDEDEAGYLRDQDRASQQQANRFIHDLETPDNEEE